MNFSAKLRLYFHICKSFLEKVTEKVVDSHILLNFRIIIACISEKSYWIKKRKINEAERKNLYSNCLMSAETLSKTVLINGVWIWAIRIVM